MKNLKIFLVWIALILSVVNSDAQDQTAGEATTHFKVFGVCEQCKKGIEDAAKGKGLKTVSWNIDTKIVSLVYITSQSSLEKIQTRIVKAGHDLENKKANDAVYEALPPCCYYRDIAAMTQQQESIVACIPCLGAVFRKDVLCGLAL